MAKREGYKQERRDNKKKLYVFWGLILVSVFFLFSNVLVKADKDQKTIRIGYIDYEGFINQNEDESYSGYGVELLNEIATYTGWNYEFVLDTFTNHLEGLKQGNIDFICHAQKTEKREQEYLFSKYPTGSEVSVLYGRKDDTRFYYNDFLALNGATIGFMDGSFQNEEFEHYAKMNGIQFQSKCYATKTETFQALDTGQVDAVAMGSLDGIQGYKVISLFGSNPFYFMTGNQNQKLVEKLDSALGQIYAMNPIFDAQLYDKYYSNKAASDGMLFTREEAEYIANANDILVGLMPERSPLSYEDAKGNPKGMIVELMDLVAKKSGLRFSYTFLKIGQKEQDFLYKGQGDLVAGVGDSDFSDINENLIQSKSLQEDSVVFVGRIGANYSTSKKLTVALPAGFVHGEKAVSAVYPNFEFYHGTTNKGCLQAVRDGKADVMLQNLYVIREVLQSPLYENLEVFPAYTFVQDEKVVALPENILLISIINKAIDSITQEEANITVITNTIAKGHHTSLKEIIYKYRLPLSGILVLFLAIIAMVLAITIIRQHNYVTIERMNKKLQLSNSQLADAVAQADRANTAKSHFLSRMSHEIRTPLNAIVGLTEIAKNHEKEPDKMKDSLGKIQSSSRVLLNIINDVLDMSAIENNKLKIANETFNIKQVLTQIGTIYYPQCEEKGISFHMTCHLEHVVLIGDSLRVSQILLNLVSNAYKFTESGGMISIDVSETAKNDQTVFVRFLVADTGCGMAPEMLERIFKPFEQETAATAQIYGGSGLGTSIAKNLVDLMHGAIQVESTKGKGTTFKVDLPFGLEEESTKNMSQKKFEKSQPFIANHNSGVTKEKTDPKYDFTGHRVLLVEDNDLNAEIANELLQLVNMQSDHASNGKIAVEMFHNSEPGTYDAILMDVQMPEMNGYEATQKIRELNHIDARNIPIFAMTANAFNEDISSALSAGMNGHIGKPIDTAVLYEQLQQVIQNQQNLDESIWSDE